jgi:Glycosyl transferases group 1
MKKALNLQALLLGCEVATVALIVILYNICFDLGVIKSPIAKEVHSPELSTLNKKFNVGIIVQKSTLGDREIAQRYKIAAEQLGWNAYVFKYKATLGRYWITASIVKCITSVISYFFKPDFFIVQYPSYYPVLPAHPPKYLTIFGNIDAELQHIVSLVKKEPQGFINDYQYIGDYDGYIDVNKKHDWLTPANIKLLSHTENINEKVIINSYPSTFSTQLAKLEYKQLFYCGGNWDSFRSSDFFKGIMLGLKQKGYLNIYGPEKTWEFTGDAYKGYLPDDGYSLVKMIQDSGISLIVHSEFHNLHGIPSGRIFEAAAAGSVIISDQNQFVKDEFSACVNFIDFTMSQKKVIEQIDHFVRWAQNNPEEAFKQAACAHKTFMEKFTLEKLLLKLAAASIKKIK